MTRRALTTVVAVVVAVGILAVVLATTPERPGSGSGGDGPVTGAPADNLELRSSVTTPTTATAVLPMGNLDDPANTFWQLLVRAAGAASWSLATPPGVADNGGLVVGVTASSSPTSPPSPSPSPPSPPGTLVAGFLPSADLRFSPVSRSSDGGHSWTGGQLPSGLVTEPDALATGPTSQLAAIVAGHGGSVLISGGSLTAWTTPTDELRSPARTGPGCHVRRFTAASYTSGGGLIVGGDCSAATTFGLSELSGTAPPPGWHPLGTGTVRGATSVLRLERTANGTGGLGVVRAGGGRGVVAFWSEGDPGTGAPWSTSPMSPVPAGWTVVATAMGGGDGDTVAVLLSSGGLRRIVSVAGPGRPWVELPAPPAGTASVAVVGGETDAFVTAGSTLTTWSLSGVSGTWSWVGSFKVPIQYGSSD